MRYVLHELLTVRGLRVDAASQEVSTCRKTLVRSQQQLKTKELELQEYIASRIAQEQQLYAAIMGQKIRLKDLEDVKTQVQLLRGKQASYEQQVLDAQRSVLQATENLAQAEEKLRRLLRAQEKLNEHRELWRIEVRQLMQRKEDNEQEDLPFRSRPLWN